MNSDETYRRRLYDIRRDAERPLAEKLTQFLSLGCEYLDVENGHLKRVDADRGQHFVVASAGAATDLVAVGDVHDHATTFCRRTLERSEPLAVSHADEDGWRDDPARGVHGLECYLGTTVTVDGTTFGTLCFVARTPHSREFSAAERAFVELMASIIGTELAAKGYAKRLTDHDKLLAVLNRILRHNLRNDVNVLQGYASELATRLCGDDRKLAEQIETKADELVAMGEKARKLETIVRDDTPPIVEDVVPIFETVRTELASTAANADVSVTGPDELYAVTSGYLQTALYELGENALEHAASAPVLDLRVRSIDEGQWCVITVADDGPGLSQLEQDILRGQQETQLSHGQGVGLWMVYWIVMKSGGTIDVDVTDGTTVDIYLHHVEEPDEPQWARRLYLSMAALL